MSKSMSMSKSNVGVGDASVDLAAARFSEHLANMRMVSIRCREVAKARSTKSYVSWIRELELEPELKPRSWNRTTESYVDWCYRVNRKYRELDKLASLLLRVATGYEY